jgi:hypothetical protein
MLPPVLFFLMNVEHIRGMTIGKGNESIQRTLPVDIASII